MYQLPLFPLKTILFPGMPVNLHIFEERYKDMMNLCITENQPFGVVLIRDGKEAGGPARPHKIGCTAHIAQVQPLRDGRMNMVAIGRDRFRIHALSYDKPYLSGTVENIPLDTAVSADARKLTRQLRVALTRYLHILSNVGEVEFNVEKLPEEELELAYLAATLMQMPNNKKQEMLTIDSLSKLLHTVYDTCRQEISVLRMMLSPDVEPVQQGPFSMN